ncbi:hypothetical protein P3T76_002233 [Phytophthora citrophthora]|uniref:Heterokaryon incompatibility domain-containing protein n=1 Tax=Phytophthora citrophthora TaxID=4793 RepID=A0AAD9GZA0_9STRA|nr:hypothetical protein P3T76_002233 [Phytophthora citrophthora]
MHVFKLHFGSEQVPGGTLSKSGLYVLERRILAIGDSLEEIIAISYAWGSLDHEVAESWVEPLSGEEISLKLGPEWDPIGFLDELVELSTGTSSWIWMDQFSLSQSGVTTAELSISIPAIYKNARVLVLLPGSHCKDRESSMKRTIGSCTAVARLLNHSKNCTCIGGIDMWLKRAWPWQEVAYAHRLRLKFAGGAGPRLLPNDTMTLLRQQILHKCIEEGVNHDLGVDWSFGSDQVGGHQIFMDLVQGNEIRFNPFVEPTGQQILQYMSDYVEQCRVCTKDIDLVSAVAPAIGAQAVAGRSLSEGIGDLIEYIQQATHSVYVGPLPQGILTTGGSSYLADERTFSSLQSVTFLHGSHFAVGYESGKDLKVEVDYTLHVVPFPEPEDGRTHKVGHLLNYMSLGQRRMLVRWLNTWEPGEPIVQDGILSHGALNAVFSHLKKYVQKVDVTSSVQGNFYTGVTVDINSRSWTQLVMILLRVIEDGVPSDIEARLMNFCRLVTVEGPGGTSAIGYMSASVEVLPTVVAAGNCLMLAFSPDISDEIEELHTKWPWSKLGQPRVDATIELPSGPPPRFQVLGRLPFVSRASIGFENRCLGRMKPDNDKGHKTRFPGKYAVTKRESYSTKAA